MRTLSAGQPSSGRTAGGCAAHRSPSLRAVASQLVIAGAACLTLSCALIPTTLVVDVSLPRTPVHWREAWGEAAFEVSWTSVNASGTVAGLHGAGARVTIDVPRTPPVAIIARPRWPSRVTPPGDWAAPAGALVSGASGPVIEASFRTGPAAEILRRLLTGGADLGDFNLTRLLVEIDERLADDPWAIDVERVVDAIGSRAMRASYIRQPERHDTGLLAPAGRWQQPSPFREPVAGGSPWPGLPVGVTRFVSSAGTLWVVSVDEEGRGWQPPVP